MCHTSSLVWCVMGCVRVGLGVPIVVGVGSWRCVLEVLCVCYGFIFNINF